MNLQLANVLSDISGKSGQAILHAILEGERDPYELAALCNYNVKASEEEIARSLEGNWQEDLLFLLQQNKKATSSVRSRWRHAMHSYSTISRKGRIEARAPACRKRTQTTRAQEQEESSAVRRARTIISHRGGRPLWRE